MTWWPKRREKDSQIIASSNSALPAIEKFGEMLTPNLRALRFTMTVCDQLLSMGISANSVVSKALDITETYCQRPVHIDINANLLMLSQLRGNDKEPLTIMRPVALRTVNNMTIQAVQRLVYEIRNGRYTLDKAELALEAILKQPKKYAWWVMMVGNGSITAGVSLMFTTSWHVLVITFVIGALVDRIQALMIRQAIPSFFRQVGAALLVTLLAATIALMANHGVTFFNDINPTLIVVGGIIMLVAGLTIVGAIQDAIDEYYVTATAYILKVGMLTVGIVIGILIGLYIARKFGFGIAVSPNPLSLTAFHLQVIGGAIAATAYALVTQTRIRALLWAGLVGGAALAVTYAASRLGVSVIPASGIAAIFAGLVASLFSRLWRTPSSGIIAAGIVPLVPGLALYNGLMQLINAPAGSALFGSGVGTLFTALATALAIAAGASFGILVGRPLHQNITHNRNIVPFVNFMRRQLKLDNRQKLAGLALNHAVDIEPDKSLENGGSV